MLLPLLIVFYAGELVWRERDAGMSEITDAAPVPEWVLFLGKFRGLTLVLVVWMALVTAAGVLGQMRMGYFHFRDRVVPADSLRTATHRLRPLCTARLRGACRGESETRRLPRGTDRIRGSRLPVHLRAGTPPAHLWVRSEVDLLGHPRFRSVARAVAVVQALLGGVGGAAGRCGKATVGARRRARFMVAAPGGAPPFHPCDGRGGRVGGGAGRGPVSSSTTPTRSIGTVPRPRRPGGAPSTSGDTESMRGSRTQPSRAPNLHVEIYPDRREAEIRGAYVLANTRSAAIDSIHVTTVPGVEAGAVSVDRPASPLLVDDDLGYRIYSLEKPLQPGDSLHLNFEVHIAAHGFRNQGADAFVVQNGSHFTNRDWLPAIGYQRNRELDGV